MGQKHFTRTEEIADHTHPCHQRPFDDIERAFAIFPGFLGIDIDVIDNALDERVLEPLLHGLLAPNFILGLRFSLRLNVLGEVDQSFGRVFATI